MFNIIKYLAFFLFVIWISSQFIPNDQHQPVNHDYSIDYKNDKGSLYDLGWKYFNGTGVPQDKVKALECWKKADAQGDHRGQSSIGNIYDKGDGVPQDKKKALWWYLKAAELGDPVYQYTVALMYDRGDGIQQDTEKASHWYKKAADQGHPASMNNLEKMNFLTIEEKRKSPGWYGFFPVEDMRGNWKPKAENEANQTAGNRDGTNKQAQATHNTVTQTFNGGKTTQSIVEQTYWRAVAQRVKSFWVLPEKGKWDSNLLAMVVITINKDGEIVNIQFDQKSSDPLFDQLVVNQR